MSQILDFAKPVFNPPLAVLAPAEGVDIPSHGLYERVSTARVFVHLEEVAHSAGLIAYAIAFDAYVSNDVLVVLTGRAGVIFRKVPDLIAADA